MTLSLTPASFSCLRVALSIVKTPPSTSTSASRTASPSPARLRSMISLAVTASARPAAKRNAMRKREPRRVIEPPDYGVDLVQLGYRAAGPARQENASVLHANRRQNEGSAGPVLRTVCHPAVPAGANGTMDLR